MHRERSDREWASHIQPFRKFPDDATAREGTGKIVWLDGPHCPHCVQPTFSLESSTSPRLTGAETVGQAAFLVTTNLKGVSGMKLHRDIEIARNSAWHLMHRLRKTRGPGQPVFAGLVEADETCIGGLEKNTHADTKLNAGRGAAGMSIVGGVKERETGQVAADVIPDTGTSTLQGFVETHMEPEAQAYSDTDGHVGIDGAHECVNHSADEHVRELAHTKGPRASDVSASARTREFTTGSAGSTCIVCDSCNSGSGRSRNGSEFYRMLLPPRKWEPAQSKERGI